MLDLVGILLDYLNLCLDHYFLATFVLLLREDLLGDGVAKFLAFFVHLVNQLGVGYLVEDACRVLKFLLSLHVDYVLVINVDVFELI